MEFGLFHEFQQAPGEGPARAFAQSGDAEVSLTG